MRAICVVDPLGSGEPFIEECEKRELTVVILYTVNKKLIEEFQEEDTNEQYRTLYLNSKRTNLEEIIQELKKLNILAIIPAWETAIEWADKIAKELNLIGNDPKSSACRRDKYAMRKAFLAGNLLPENFQFMKCKSISELLAFTQNWQGPLVVKTPRGAATNKVFICKNFSEARNALDAVLQEKNVFGEKAPYAVVETFFTGVEYFVNLIVDKNAIYLVDIWKYLKNRNSHGVVFYEDVIQIQDPKVKDYLVAFAIKSTKATKIDYGAVHFEVLWDHNTNALLPIEIAGRLGGGKAAELVNKYSNVNIYQCLIDIYLYGSMQNKFEIKFDKNLGMALCHSYKNGIVDHISGLEKIKALPSYESHFFHNIKPHHYHPETSDMVTVPLFVHLANKDSMQLLQDIAKTHQFFKIWYEKKKKKIKRQENKEPLHLPDIVLGSAILGSGGGGPLKLGYQIADEIHNTGIKPRLINIDDLDDNDFIIGYGAVGSAEIGESEIFPDIPEFIEFIKNDLGYDIAAIIPLEIGAVNSILPFKIATNMHLPIVDGDMCGRAVPSLNLTGISLTAPPNQKFKFYCLTQQRDYISIYSAPHKAEEIFRAICGNSGIISTFMYPAQVRHFKNICARNSMTIAAKMGAWIRKKLKSIQELDNFLKFIEENSSYQNAKIIARGDIVKNETINQKGFLYSKLTIFDDINHKGVVLHGINEFYKVLIDEKEVAEFPDIISVFNNTTHLPLTSDDCLVNLSVTVIRISGPEIMLFNEKNTKRVFNRLLDF